MKTVLIVAALVWLPAEAVAQSAARQPNLNGIWQALNTAAWDIQDHPARVGVPAGQGVVEGNDIPYQAWALAKKLENFRNRLTAEDRKSVV